MASSKDIKERLVRLNSGIVKDSLRWSTLPEYVRPNSAEEAEPLFNAYGVATHILRRVLDLPDHSEEVELVRQERDQLREEFNAVQQALVAEQQHRQQLHEMNVTLSKQLAHYQNAPPASSRPARMADPDKFDGTRDKLRPFLVQIRLKLNEPNAFPTEQAKLAYIVSRLEGIAFDQVATAVKANGIDFADSEAMLSALTAAFDDPDRVGTATRKLQTLRQANRQFSDFFAEFQRYALQSGWDNKALHAQLRHAASYELRSALTNILDEPTSYEELAQLLTRIDNKQRALKQDGPPRNPSTQPRTQTAQQSAPRAAATPAAAAPAPHPTNTNSGNYGPAPMDLSAGRRHLSQQERLRRLTEGRCLYCGGAGHMAVSCPNKPGAIRAAAVNPGPPLSPPPAPVSEADTTPEPKN